MSAIQGVCGNVTAPTAVFGAVATVFVSGNGTIHNFSQGNAWLLTVWQNQNTTAGSLRIFSPRLHDVANGITLRAEPAMAHPCLTLGFPQRLIAQDTLTVQISGSAVGADIVNFCLLIYYDSLDSANGRFTSLTELEQRMVNILTLQHALVGNVAGVFGAAQALTAAVSFNMKANTDYCLLGQTCSESAPGNGASIGLTGVDTGNLRITMPLMGGDSDYGDEFFVNLSKRFGRSMLPTVNAANAGATLLDVQINENADTVTTTTIWAELRG
jgi:hypothetical protein